jgi:hypothetical protein
MASRVTLAKDLAAGSNGASIFPKSRRPYVIQSDAGYTGSVTVEQSVDGPDVSDANASWTTGTTLAANDQITIDGPVYRIRVRGSHTGTATVFLLEDPPR